MRILILGVELGIINGPKDLSILRVGFDPSFGRIYLFG